MPQAGALGADIVGTAVAVAGVASASAAVGVSWRGGAAEVASLEDAVMGTAPFARGAWGWDACLGLGASGGGEAAECSGCLRILVGAWVGCCVEEAAAVAGGAAAAASRRFWASSALRFASRSSSSFNLATVSTGLALPNGLALGLGGSEAPEGLRGKVRLPRGSLRSLGPRSSWEPESELRGPPASPSLGALASGAWGSRPHRPCPSSRAPLKPP